MAAPGVVAFVGVDDAAVGLAQHFRAAGYALRALDEEDTPAMKEFVELGGSRANSAAEAVKGAAAVIILVTDANAADDLLFGNGKLVEGMDKDAIIFLRAFLLAENIQIIEGKLLDVKSSAFLVDSFVFWEASDTSERKIVVVASGREMSVQKAQCLLSDLSDVIGFFDSDIGTSSKIKLVNALLEGINTIASIEAMSFGVRAGVHPSIIYDVISNAAGSSRIFVELVSQLLHHDSNLINTFSLISKNARRALDVAKAGIFPLPLLSVAYQQLIRGCSMMAGKELTSQLQVFEELNGVNVTSSVNQQLYDPSKLADQVIASCKSVKRVGFIGLGAMGFGMASSLLKSGFIVVGYDVYKPKLSMLAELGGLTANSPKEVSQDIEVLIIMVATEAQAENVLFGDVGSLEALPTGATIILSSTVSPGYVINLEKRLKAINRELKLVDAPVSGGVQKAAEGNLTIMASGSDEALHCCGSVLSALSQKLYIIGSDCGAGSSVKIANQCLAGIHIAAAAEAMAFGASLNVKTKMLFDIILHARGCSWMFGNRVPHMLAGDYTPHSAVDIFVKDLGIVCAESANMGIPVHISAISHQLFLSGSAFGWGRIDDAGVVKFYEMLTGVHVESKPPILIKKDALNSLPSEWPENPTQDIYMQESANESNSILVVLDDDPTGTQTVHDIDVLTEWHTEILIEQFQKKPSCFFILTNSRALTANKASLLINDICQNLEAASHQVSNITYTIVLRGDSTLRGHFPEEADAVVSAIGEVDCWIICPFFLQGGRVTVNDIHYVADGERLIPAGETEFAKDAYFGYKSSNLKQWVEEKTKGRIRANEVSSISISLLRKEGPAAVCEHLCNLKKGSVCIINAASERDVAVFAAGMIQAERRGKRFLCRTAASFVSARIGIKPKPPLHPSDLCLKRDLRGGLIVVGSYVPKTTKQVEELLSRHGHDLRVIEVSVDRVAMKSSEERNEEIVWVAEVATASLKLKKNTLIVTSRQLITGKTPEENLEINCKVSSALVEIVRKVETRPRFIIAKGGITSSDIATKALGTRRAKVMGQALAGIPLWQLGPESTYPGVPYIVFPGNVGDNSALANVVGIWTHPPRFSTKELLENAEKGGYAVGAFNVYNIEGIEAVVSAAENENSPAILQIHPSSLQQGGLPLVSCCIAAADRSQVPITVHFDHGIVKSDLLEALEMDFDSIMVDGSNLPFMENIVYTKTIASLAHAKGILVEAELGRLSGTEDGLTVEEYEAKLTDIAQAREFINETNIDALAVCIGNVHGKYPHGGPIFKLDLLKDLGVIAKEKGIHLVLHGASGVPKELVKQCIDLGVRKFNVNTEVRNSYIESLRTPQKDLVQVMASAKEAMKAVVAEKLRLFGSAGKAW